MLSFLATIVAAIGPKPIPCVPGLPCITPETQKSGASIREYVLDTFGTSFLSGFLGIVGLTSVVFIIVGGIQMYLAAGNDEALQKAKKTVLWAIGGLIVSILSVAIVSIISKIEFK